MMTTVKATIRCRCGQRTYSTMAEAHAAEPNGLFKCPNCYTFASDHEYWGGDEGRCFECDTRAGSHR
jgi:hypothetical protein